MSTKASNLNVGITAKQTIWGNKNFVILLLSGFIISIGSKIYELALPLILYDLTKSSVIMSTMKGIEFLPNLFLAIFIGVIVDRVNKKRWSLWAIAIQSIVLIGLYVMINSGYTHPGLFYITGFILMTCSYAYFNARISIAKHVLPKELLTSANASFSFISTFIGIMGPAITGFILLFSNLQDGLLLTAISFVMAFGAMCLLDSNEEKIEKKDSNFWQELKDGWIELRTNRPLWLMTILVIFTNATSGMVMTMIIFFAKENLRLDNGELGLVLSCAGLGGLIGSSLISYLRKKIPLGILLGLNIILVAFAYLILSQAENIWIFGIGIFLEALFGIMAAILIWTFRLESTPNHLIGRITGLTGSIFKLAMPFAIFAAGYMADWFNPAFVFSLAAILNVIFFIVYIRTPLWKLS
ncbi:MFS family permease [Salirhabdus euzebyi]|uniref:MFS family permease n=1 Tax=Salirhabdus euzebyi TaxID=394506 RepID=A0A841Q5E3_9BACI|nr:MFS transporter [Salirhabdus euzebyi]MBB6453552.1 MFS family permease [Salirhabdus euzebyi]